jgi:hypothetical protein
MATGFSFSTRLRRQAGSQGRSQMRPRTAGKDVGNPVDHIGVVVAAVADQADIFRDRGVGGAGILTVDNLMKIFRVLYLGRFHEGIPCLENEKRIRTISVCSIVDLPE